MKSITIAGINESSAELIKNIRNSNKDIKIDLIDEKDYLFDKWEICNWLTSKANAKIVKIDDFVLEFKVNLIKAKIDRVNFNKKKIFLKDKDAHIYERLIIATRLKSKDISIKGDSRQGFFYLGNITPYKLRDMFKISSDIIVSASTILGIDWALKLTRLKKDIKCVISDTSFLGDKKEKILLSLKQNNIDVYTDCKLVEAIGENAIKAARISRPMVLSAHVVICDSGFTYNERLIKDDFVQKDIFNTNQTDVFLLGAICEKNLENDFFFIHAKENLNTQATILAKYLLGDESLDYQPKVHTDEEISGLVDNLLSEFYTEVPEEEVREESSAQVTEQACDIEGSEENLVEEVATDDSLVEEDHKDEINEEGTLDVAPIEKNIESSSREPLEVQVEEPKTDISSEPLKLASNYQEPLKLNGPEKLEKLGVIESPQENTIHDTELDDRISDSNKTAIT